MGLVLEIFGPAAILSAAVALALILISQRALRGRARDPIAVPAATALAFMAGYAALPSNRGAALPAIRALLELSPAQLWAALAPDQSWQRLPYLGVAVAIVAAIRRRGTRAIWHQWLLPLGVSALFGWLLTPSWPVFGLNRPASIAIAMAYFLLIASPLELLPARLLGRALVPLLTLAAAIAAVVIGAEVSLRFAQLAGLATGALAGCWLARPVNIDCSEDAQRGLILVFVALIGGISLVATVEPDPPLVALLALPMTPLLAWLGAFFQPRAPITKS
jgi:hypothetical protein